MIFGVMMVRNEEDILRVNLLHHLALGIDHVLVVDNGSTDRTRAILEEFAGTGRVHAFSREGRFRQSDTTTEFAREAFLRGATWVVPIDADEFWDVPGGSLHDVLDDCADAGALEVEVINFVQQRSQEMFDTRALLTMTRRAPQPVGVSGEADLLVESGRVAFVECRYPPKHISRASLGLEIAMGNHSVRGTGGPTRRTARIVCLHAPLRARADLTKRKVHDGRERDEISDYMRSSWHIRRWRRLAERGDLDAEWDANSYLDDCLDVRGTRHPLVIDTRLSDIVKPWLDATPGALPAQRRDTPGTTTPPLPELDPATTRAILDRMRATEGWFRDEEAELLLSVTRRAVAEHGDAAVLEIGSFCGKSTIVLASAARTVSPSARVHAIDPHEGNVGAEDTPDGVRNERPTFERFRSNVARAGVADVIEAVRLRSYEVIWRSPIGLLFIDGLHDYASVARDFFHFERHVVDRGYVAFHDCDTNYPGVSTFVAGLAASDCYEEVSRAASLVVFRKVAASGSRTPASADLADPMALSLRLVQQEKGIAFLIDELASRDRRVQEREEGIEWLRGVVRDKELTIAELEKGVAWLRKEIEERDFLLRALQASEPT